MVVIHQNLNKQALHVQARSSLGLVHLWTKVFEMIPLDVSQEEYVTPGSSHAISAKHINQKRRNLVDQGTSDAVAPIRDVQPQPEAGTSHQVPQETGEPVLAQPSILEVLLKGFEDIQAKVAEGFARLSDCRDSLDATLVRHGEAIQVLEDRLRRF
ncbi:hypothetical protein PIB30_007724 [Stylosanthes scabra]|uniref:Uncharacterized protein n=1 Tax=Stylosanthes scabra TaxID=79078 RepID=A0ABU6Y4X0_9FABA|nr:hypothetical protein [Stylosanthes scabra]